MRMKNWEIAMLIGAAAAIVFCAAPPRLTAQWWTAAFPALCDGLVCGDAAGGGVVLRSKLWELLSQYVVG